ncbi:hypothetical protein [Neisseria sicca]
MTMPFFMGDNPTRSSESRQDAFRRPYRLVSTWIDSDKYEKQQIDVAFGLNHTFQTTPRAL